ncbi:MAG: metallopeptidase TldD-related protein [bacterium]
MLELVTKKLRALGCETWAITETRKKSWEFYFIRHALDQHRAVETSTISLEVYRPLEDGSLGSASDELNPTATEAEIDRTLRNLWLQASLVKNPAFALPASPIEIPARLEPVDIEGISAAFLEAMASVPETETEDVNSYEIFVSELTRHTRNSNGVEYTCVYPSSMAEVVVNARKDGHEIELYRNFTSGSCDPAQLRADIADAMRYGRDRLRAQPTPHLGTGAVVFSTEDAVRIYEYFARKMNAGAKYRHLTDWETGKPIAADMTGDRLTLRGVPSLENSSHDFPVDPEGSLIRERTLIEAGVAGEFYGSKQFADYIGLADSSNLYNFIVSGSERPVEDVRRGDYLEVVEFSDFQVSPMGGEIAGEIRLGYLHRGGEVSIVSGGSVTGSMLEAVRDMTFSQETTQYDTWRIPRVTRLENLRITGTQEE